MNLPNKTNGMAGENIIATVASGFFRQIRQHGIICARLKMQLLHRAGNLATVFTASAFCLMQFSASAQTNYYSANGTEYAIVGPLAGDQVTPAAAISTNGGYLVWSDNATDGDSWGVSARKLDSTLSGTLGTFRVNTNGVGAQENPRVALLQGGGAVFVWQGGKQGFQHIYARFLNSGGTFTGGNDILMSATTNNFQINPAVTVLNNGNVVVVWQSYNQVGVNSMQDVYGRIFNSAGSPVTGEFLVNQFSAFNQRSPTVAAQPSGGFLVGWVSEQQRAASGTNSVSVSYSSFPTPSVDIYARSFNSAGTALANEFLVNTDNKPCSNPALAVATDGSYAFTWTARDLTTAANSLDVFARTYNSSGTGGAVIYANSRTYGDEYFSKISAIGLDFLITWTSLGQDGSREGVYGRFIHNNGTYNSGEFRVNTTTVSQQMDPCVASDGNSQFIIVWRSFVGATYGSDLYAQRYLNMQVGLPAMSQPYVWAPFVVSNNVYQPQLVVSWAPLVGISVSNYEVYVNGLLTPTASVTTNQWTMTAANGLGASSSNSFAVDYVTTDGRRSPLSPSVGGITWSSGNYYGVPFDWMISYYGYNFASWPTSVNTPLTPGGLTLLQVFISGGNPTNPATWLKQTMTRTVQGMFLNWNTTPGATYQVQQTTNLKTWSNVGSPRFAAGATDQLNVGGSSIGYYRIILLR